MNTAVSVESLSKIYGSPGISFLSKRPASPPALCRVDLSIRDGEMIGLLGPNGAGKTTLLKIIATLLSPSSGKVVVHGIDAVRHPIKARSLLGLVTSDERSFFWRLSGRHNLEFFSALYGLPKTAAEKRINELLEGLGLGDAADRPFHGYSAGMKQKLAIARGLLGDPPIILYDEPTRSLDPVSAKHVRQWIVENRRKRPDSTHILATNLLNEAELLCDRVVIINHGTLVTSGTIGEIRRIWSGHATTIHRVTCRNMLPNGFFRPQPDRGLLEVNSEAIENGNTLVTLRTAEPSDGLSLILGHVLRSGGMIVRCTSEETPFDDLFHSIVSHKGVPGQQS